MNSLAPKTYDLALERARKSQAKRREKVLASNLGFNHPQNRRTGLSAKKRTGRPQRPAIAKKARLRAKPDPKMAAWSKAVKERDGNQCQAQKFSGLGAWDFTGLPCSGPLDAHHIAERSLRPDLKYDVANGIALCRTHHRWLPLNRKEAIRIGLLSAETYELAARQR